MDELVSRQGVVVEYQGVAINQSILKMCFEERRSLSEIVKIPLRLGVN